MIVYESIKNEEWHEMKWYSKILYVPIGSIFTSLMRVSIPPTGENNWDRRFASVFPIFAFAFATFLFKLYENPLILIIGFPIVIACGILIYCTTHRTIPPSTVLVFL